MAAGEIGELVPGRGGDDPLVVGILPLDDHPVVVHVVPHGIRGEREADDVATALGGALAAVAAARGQRRAQGRQRGARGGGAQEVTPGASFRRHQPLLLQGQPATLWMAPIRQIYSTTVDLAS